MFTDISLLTAAVFIYSKFCTGPWGVGVAFNVDLLPKLLLHRPWTELFKVRSQSLYLCPLRVFHETPVDRRAFSNFNFADCVWSGLEEARTQTHTSYFNGWIAPIVLAAAVITLLLGFCRSSLATALNRGRHIPQDVIWLWREYSHLPEDFRKRLQPPGATFNFQTMKRAHLLKASLVNMNPPTVSSSEEARMSGSSLWRWWLLWLSTLNFNPQQPTVPISVELYVLLMMAKFHTWKAGIVAWVKDPVSAPSLTPCLFLFSASSLSFLLSVSSHIMRFPALGFYSFILKSAQLDRYVSLSVSLVGFSAECSSFVGEHNGVWRDTTAFCLHPFSVWTIRNWH